MEEEGREVGFEKRVGEVERRSGFGGTATGMKEKGGG
jgi:hypothetical protein